MRHRILTLAVFFLSMHSFIQAQAPPCGYFAAYGCNEDGDGFAAFNLVDEFPFYAFCTLAVESDYGAIVFYETKEDMLNETNPITNPTNYINISSSQVIYTRANALDVNTNPQFVSSEDFLLEVKSLLTNISDLKAYSADEIATFDLTTASIFCDDINVNDYTVTYHESSTGANSSINAISNPTNFVNETNPDRIYVRVVHNITGYVEVGNFGLSVLFAKAFSPENIELCDNDQDGFQTFDLTIVNPSILRNQDPNVFKVSYFLNLTDAENNTSSIVSPETFVNTVNPQSLYARVEENISGSYAITSFGLEVKLAPQIIEPSPIEVCDDVSNDGIAFFDLSTKAFEIMNGLTGDVVVSYHETLSDAENHLNLIANPSNFSSSTSTVYVKVSDVISGCYSIVSLELIVQDCTTRGVIEINAFYDEDENATFENDEINFLNGVLTYEKNNDGIQRKLHSSNGIFKIISDSETNTYDISYSILEEFNPCYSITTPLYENISISNGSTVNYNFPITKTIACGDIAVYLASYVPPRPGFDYKNYLVIRNRGLETVSSGIVEFNMDTTLTLNSIVAPSGISIENTATGVNLNFTNLEPNQSKYVKIEMNVPIPTPLGTLLTNTATYSVTDLSVENNTSTLSEVVIGSFDPNDINESHGPEILHSSFTTDDYLYYTIRFQNVGTADAINVSIDNTLDVGLDASSIQMLSSSHTNVFTRTGSQLNWQFDNIHLPSEDMDEPNSHGYVYYKIKPKAGYVVGDVIPNTAEIYFDFNPAVVTNTFETEFVATLTKDKKMLEEFLMQPNPAKDFVELSFENSINKFQANIYDIQGKLVLTNENVKRINVSGLKTGLYFLEINTKKATLVKKLVIQ